MTISMSDFLMLSSAQKKPDIICSCGSPIYFPAPPRVQGAIDGKVACNDCLLDRLGDSGVGRLVVTRGQSPLD
ncbi:MAG: hypothetical protein Q7S34_04235 [bacterium]|nr:hypothetical protein [bacterium]